MAEKRLNSLNYILYIYIVCDHKATCLAASFGGVPEELPQPPPKTPQTSHFKQMATLPVDLLNRPSRKGCNGPHDTATLAVAVKTKNTIKVKHGRMSGGRSTHRPRQSRGTLLSPEVIPPAYAFGGWAD